MAACCSAFECAADQQFNEKKATEELKRFRTKGPRPTTRLLQQGLEHAGALSGTLLDIGSGIGSLTFGLLERGIIHAVAVDASSAYNAVAREEAARLGRADVMRFVNADFVSVAPELPAATVVTLDRVVCCYPSYEALLRPVVSQDSRFLLFMIDERGSFHVRYSEIAADGTIGPPRRVFNSSPVQVLRPMDASSHTRSGCRVVLSRSS